MPFESTVLGRVDSSVASTHRQLRRALGRPDRVRLAPYRGWVTADRAVVLGRAIEMDPTLEGTLERAPRLIRVAYERFLTLERRDVSVKVAWRAQTVTCSTNLAGFIDVSFEIAGSAPSEATTAELTLADVSGAGAMAEVLAFRRSAQLGVISDIDDTVLETEVTNPWKRMLQLVYSEQRMRLPFDGIAALYQAFAHGGRPIFYVSNAPWNLYPHVLELLDHHDIPKGPLLLRDKAIAERLAPSPAGENSLVHKQRALRRIMEDYPSLTFVLLGDSTRRDPLRYVEIAEAFPRRVAAIYIRRVSGLLARRDDLSPLQERAKRVGVELLIADDTVTIASHARSRGLVAPWEVGHVREGKRQDEQAPPTELTSVLSATPGGK
jgi:phosphatidate phosphatase APP1